MITLQSADSVLKDVYLGVIADKLNSRVNPLYNRIKKSTKNIVGKEIHLAAPIGINGGVCTGLETSELPESANTPYLQYVAPLKNLYGKFEISDKALRCASADVNNFINMVESEMEALIKASVFNLSRMNYGDGTGAISNVDVKDCKVYVKNPGAYIEGMYVDFYTQTREFKQGRVMVEGVDIKDGKLHLEEDGAVMEWDYLYWSGSKDTDIIGLKGIVGNETLYGNVVADHRALQAQKFNGEQADRFDEDYIQDKLDYLEQIGSKINFINCSYQLKRLYQKYARDAGKNIDYAVLEDGTHVPTFGGIPIVPTNHLEAAECFFLNTDDFNFYQLGDWRWIEDEDGRVLKQLSNKAAYSATLVKYTELICDRPSCIGYSYNMKTSYSK